MRMASRSAHMCSTGYMCINFIRAYVHHACMHARTYHAYGVGLSVHVTHLQAPQLPPMMDTMCDARCQPKARTLVSNEKLGALQGDGNACRLS